MPDPATPEAPTMVEIVAVLSETYTDDGVAFLLAKPHKSLWPEWSTAEMCRTPEGRRRVLEWAESLTGMVAT